jgi:hypothetical protein
VHGKSVVIVQATKHIIAKVMTLKKKKKEDEKKKKRKGKLGKEKDRQQKE